MEKTCYRILGVPPDASSAEIRRAFRCQARRCHPDTAAPGMANQTRFQELLAAYRLLGSPSKRACYDAQLAKNRSCTGTFLRRRLGKFCATRWLWLKTAFGPFFNDSENRVAPVSYSQPSEKTWSRKQFSGPAFGEVLAAHQRVAPSRYMLCEDGIIRPKNTVDMRTRQRPSRPPRSNLTVALRSWRGMLLVLLVGVWEVFRR